MRGKRVGGRGPKAHSKNSDFGTPVVSVLFSGIPTYTAECGSRLRVGVRAKNASVSGFACRPF